MTSVQPLVLYVLYSYRVEGLYCDTLDTTYFKFAPALLSLQWQLAPADEVHSTAVQKSQTYELECQERRNWDETSVKGKEEFCPAVIWRAWSVNEEQSRHMSEAFQLH